MMELNEHFVMDFDTEWAKALQDGLEAYMEGLYETMYEDAEGVETDAETESGEPFCGCNVCQYREILSYVVPRVLKAQKDGLASYEETADV